MKILVLGSGILGVTTAYVLASRGHEVEILERNDCCAGESSFANGGQLSYNHAEPWATRGVLKKLPKWLVHEDSPLIIRPRLDPDMIRWGLRFLRNCTQARAEINTINLLRLGFYSREKLRTIREEACIHFSHGDKGILHIFTEQKDLDAAKRQAEFQGKFGGEEVALTREECLKLEPSLHANTREIKGGIHALTDESGDAWEFCQELLKVAQAKYGVRIRYGAEVRSLVAEGDALRAVQLADGELSADAYVVALGVYTPLLMKPLGVRLPIYPMKGYSLTLPGDAHCPSRSVTDAQYKVVFTPLGDKLRVAGTAEFAGYNTDIIESRIAPMLRAGRSLFPQVNWDHPGISKWACLRPSTPDGPPILGRTPYTNLFLNTGHGTLGWTQGPGSAYIVADLIENRQPEIMLGGLTLTRRKI